MEYLNRINEAIEQVTQWHVEYCETHDDYGDNFSYFLREGSWQYNNCDDRLSEFIAEYEIDTKGLCLDDLAELAIDNHKIEPGHIFSNNPSNGICFSAYPLQEIETQIEIEEINNISGLRLTPKRLRTIADKDNEHCINGIDKDTFCTYVVTDVMWCANLYASDLQDAINDYSERYL